MSVKDKAVAIDRFVRTIKASGVYDDIGTACIMAGWTNLAGALYPLKGAAPTNVSGLFQNADLDPGIGLKGDGSSKYLNANRANNADGQDDQHLAIYVSSVSSDFKQLAGCGVGAGVTSIFRSGSNIRFRSRSTGSVGVGGISATGLYGVSRGSSSEYDTRVDGTTATSPAASEAPAAGNVSVFLTTGYATSVSTDATLSWYSIGSATDLAALDSAVSTLMADLRSIDEAGFDRDALAYIRNVEAADGSYLETGVKQAINAFVVGCKKDGIWDAIKASCIMCGARTISGALVPLVGPSPTAYPQPVNFVSADYSRTTGLKGDGATKYLDTNRAYRADGRADMHAAAYVTANPALTNKYVIGAKSSGSDLVAAGYAFYCGSGSFSGVGDPIGIGLHAVARASESTAQYVKASSAPANFGGALATAGAANPNYYVFGYSNEVGAITSATDARLAFYSIGSALDLAALDNRVSTLVAAIAAAI